ncbi:DeoR family transcriptional regulator [Yersinia enterocolitica]|nr:DeoR family transcriptional regulator [Yersinia enterocolitica]
MGLQAEKLAERLCQCVILLCQDHTLTTAVLCARFGISERTAQRDLSRLARITEQTRPGHYRLSPLLRQTFR